MLFINSVIYFDGHMKETRAQRVRAASSERREREKQELRQAILAAAQELFLAHGYEGLSMRLVAEKIGYTPTTIYLYFEDKDDLLFAVMDEAYDRFTADLEVAYRSTDDPLQRLRSLADAYVHFALQSQGAYQLIFMQRPDFLLKWKAGTKQPRAASLSILREAIQQAQHAGVIGAGDVELQSDVFWAAVHGAASLAIAMPALFGHERLERTVAAVLDAALHSLRPT
jgi:AcrR family transcriptional regulator